jgi:protein-S-isoprenylcysteine O-methyltransferase Ste14
MPGNHFILIFLWTAYCILHSLLASIGIKKKLLNILGDKFKYYRLFYTIFAFVFLVYILYYQFSIETSLVFNTSLFSRLAGIIVGGTGLVIMLICIKKYFISLSGLLSLIKETSHSTLIISGIHRYVRHPLYLGTFGFIWGAFLCYPLWTLLIADTIITVYTLIAIKYEEDKLVEEYGSSYREYQKTVPKLIPSFRSRRTAQA